MDNDEAEAVYIASLWRKRGEEAHARRVKCESTLAAFLREYRRQLVSLHDRFPTIYPDLANVTDAVARLKRELTDDGLPFVRNSLALRKTCKALGLAEQPSAIREYIRDKTPSNQET